MAAMLEGLRPTSVQFTERPMLRTSSRASSNKSRASRASASSNFETADANLSIIEIEAKLREKVRSNYDTLMQAFMNYDAQNNMTVTKGEFRRVLEGFCFPMTTEQFHGVANKVKTNPNSTVSYGDFLNKFSGREARPSTQDKWSKVTKQHTMNAQGQGGQEANTDMVEKMLRDKIKENMHNVVKGLQLYDYNRDGHIQRHELRKVLENYCFKMTDQQFDKLYQRYDYHHRGLISYKDFMLRLGVNVERFLKPKPTDDSRAALIWQQTKQPPDALAKPGSMFRKPDEAQLAGLNFDQIELEFRKRMKTNYAHIKRMFLAFDRHLDGFITIPDLKSVLNQFTLPLTDQLFSQLMDRCGVKATGKISWEYFLDKFQDAHSNENGQTIPIKPAHKYNPNMGVRETANIGEIVRLLDNHVKNAYSSFKQAFLQIDKTRAGKISRKNLRDVISKFKVQLTDGQFKELMGILDPQQTNSISYHSFLHLFEPREDMVEGHKWLNSVHRYNDTQKPAILAWETVEDVMRQKVQDQWQDFSRAIVLKDQDGTGRLFPKELRKLVEKFCLPMSNEHFESLVETLNEQEAAEGQAVGDGKVSYLRFLNKLGVTIKPGDIEGLSTQIHDSSQQREVQRMTLQTLREFDIEANAGMRTKGMTVEEIITRLKDKMFQNKNRFREAFKGYDIKRRGKVTKRDFRQVLSDFGIYTNDDQFKELCSALNFTNGHMTYMDFVENFDDIRSGGPSSDLQKVNNHRVNAIRGDQYGLSALEVESRLRNKLRENFEDLRGAFYKFDDNHKGCLNRQSFRRMLDAFMLYVNDEEFEKLCERLRLDTKSRISYGQFLERFEVRDTEEGHKWLNSVHKYNETKPTPFMTADEIHQALSQKAHRQFTDIAKAFRTMDNNGKGIIKKADLREILYKFMMPVTKEEFQKLWAKYDPEGHGHLSHTTFTKALTGEEFTPSDLMGTSQKIIKQSYKGLEEHHRNQQAKHEQITLNQASTTVTMSIEKVLQQLKDRIRDAHKDFQSAFRQYDKRNKGYLTVADIQRLLVDFNYFLDDDQFYDLLERLGVSSQNSRMYYEDFLAAFEEGRKDSYEPKGEDPGFAHTMERTAKLSPEKAEEKMNKMVEQQLPVVQAAFQSFDPDYTGRMKVTDFRRILDNFCFKMTEPQFKLLIGGLPGHTDNTVEYVAYVERFKEKDPNAKRWLEYMTQAMEETGPRPLNMEQIQEMVKGKVTENFQGFSRSFADVDYARIGVVSKDDFRGVLNKLALRLDDEQFGAFWNIQKVNDFGNLDYHEFLRRYVIEKKPATPLLSRASTGMSQMSFRSNRSGMGGRPFTPLVNAESAEKAIYNKIHKQWKEVQKQCRQLDPNSTGVISQQQFRGIMNQLDADLSDDDLRKLLVKYDLKNNFTFSYTDFLRHFIIQTPRREQTVIGIKTSARAPSRTAVIGEEASDSRLRKCVMDSWKEMRRDLRHLDPSGAGTVPEDDFREVLRHNNVDVSENEFHDLTLKFDRSRTGQINYNDFIKSFIS